MFKLRRLSSEPILEPIAEHPFERAAVFNCAVVMHGRKIHMIYRAADRDFAALSQPEPREELKFVSSFGYAVSEDGINFHRDSQPVFGGREQEAWGGRPRISKIGDTFYMVYTAFGGKTWDNHRISLASSRTYAPGSATACSSRNQTKTAVFGRQNQRQVHAVSPPHAPHLGSLFP